MFFWFFSHEKKDLLTILGRQRKLTKISNNFANIFLIENAFTHGYLFLCFIVFFVVVVLFWFSIFALEHLSLLPFVVSLSFKEAMVLEWKFFSWVKMWNLWSTIKGTPDCTCFTTLTGWCRPIYFLTSEIKVEFLPTIPIHFKAKGWREERKISSRGYRFIQR